MVCCCTVGWALAAAFVLYLLVSFIKKKLTKPNYQGKVVWITGAASGIGEQMTYQFNRHGAHVIISDLSLQGLKKVRDSCSTPANIDTVKMDMSNFTEVETVTQEVLATLVRNGKKLDVVVENAGISMRCDFVDFAFQNHLKLFDVNINGPVKHLQVILPHMIQNKSGHIVGISSTAAKLGFPTRSSYAGSKHALVGMLDCIRNEVSHHNINVTNIMPGFVRTNVSKNAMMGAAGKTFGKTDTNINEGMDPAIFAKKSVHAIYTKETQVSISDQHLLISTVFMLRNICPNLAFWVTRRVGQAQEKALANAKKE